jgi:hypothetical protein
MLNLLNNLFDLIEAFSNMTDGIHHEFLCLFDFSDVTEVKARAEKLKSQVIIMKNVIPVTHRFQPEIADFDITLEQREISRNLQVLCKEENPHVFPDCEVVTS